MSERGRTALSRIGAVLFVGALLVQLAAMVASHRRHLENAALLRRLFSDSRPDPASAHAETSVACTFPRLAELMPENARVLVVSSVLMRVSYEFYLLPRRCRMLLDFPQRIVEDLARQNSMFGWVAWQMRAMRVERHQVLCDASYAEAVAEADYVVTYFCDPPDVEGVDLEKVRQLERSVLYRVIR